MNVQSIWAGEYYAYSRYRPNNTFVLDAKKGKAIKVEKRREYGKERLTAIVVMENEAGEQVDVRARDVIDFWSDYEREREANYKEQHERAERERQEREERSRRMEAEIAERRRLREARERAEAQRTEHLVAVFTEKTGMPREIVKAIGESVVTLDRKAVEAWLMIHYANGETHGQTSF